MGTGPIADGQAHAEGDHTESDTTWRGEDLQAELRGPRAWSWPPAVAGYGRYQGRPLRLTVAGDRSTIMTAVT
jgi:hypothetical protein